MPSGEDARAAYDESGEDAGIGDQAKPRRPAPIEGSRPAIERRDPGHGVGPTAPGDEEALASDSEAVDVGPEPRLERLEHGARVGIDRGEAWATLSAH